MRWRCLLIVLSLAACSGDSDPTAAANASASCPELSGSADEEVSISLQWTNPQDAEYVGAAFSGWDAADRGVAVEIREPGGFFAVPVALLGDDPPTVAQVSYAAVPALASAGAIQPIGECLAEAGVDFAAMLPAAVAKGEVDGVRYGAPTANDTTLLLYDAAAFERAGLDPERPPRTLAEVIAAGEALRDRAGIERPIAIDAPQLSILGLDVESSVAQEQIALWVQLVKDGLLTGPDETGGLPPIGSGAAAIQYIEVHSLWGYAEAIAEGQAPNADLRVAPYPGAAAPVSPVGGGVWVVSAQASPTEMAAAARLIAWAEEPQRQVDRHRRADYFPSSPSVVDDPAIEEHWRRYPLLREGWEAFTARPLVLDGWERVMGSFATIIPRAFSAATGERPFDDAWNETVSLINTLERAQTTDAAALVTCLADHADDDRSPVGTACP